MELLKLKLAKLLPSNELIIAGGYSGQTKVKIGKIVNLFACTFHVKHVFSCLLLFLFVVLLFSLVRMFLNDFFEQKPFFHHHVPRAAILRYNRSWHGHLPRCGD